MPYFCWSLFLICSVFLPGQITLAQDVRPTSDARALHQLFGETPLGSNARQICDAARQESEESAFDLLAEWVLPGENHPGIRPVGDFRATGLPPVGEIGPDFTWGRSDDEVLRQLLQRDAIASPALQLIEAAHKTGKLRELRERIQSLAETDNESLQSKLTLLFLAEMARDDLDAARTAFERFIETTIAADRSDLRTCWSEFLVFWAGLHSPETRDMVGQYYFNLYRDPLEPNADARLAAVRDYIRTLQGTYQHLVLHKAGEPPIHNGDFQSKWMPYSLESSATRGTGKPQAFWETTGGQAFRITGHETDFLSYRIPLRGNFQVECDAYAGSSKSLSLMVAGTYTEMTESVNAVMSGSFGSSPTQIPVVPELSKFRESVRLRATVRDGVLTHFINGRPVLTRQLPPNHDPWVAIRTGNRSLGIIKDLRITGDPIVPQQIDLLVGPELDGWATYHGERLSDWQVVGNASGELELQSPRRPELAGSAAEDLLYYHRPVVEDGTIEYDFFYRQGESCVHPALGHLAFLLRPSGVSFHTITNGKHDRTELTPDNETAILKTQTEPQPLPLVENDWNRLRLAIAGDELELFLNGRRIHKQALEATDRRTFGLFHYRDRTQVRVRNIVWRGKWPKVIPQVFEQQLASKELQFLEDTLPQPTEVFEYDFTEFASPFDQLDVASGEPGDFEQRPDGTHVMTPFGKSYRNSSLAPRVRLSGDFDILAHFDRLSLNPSKGGSSGVFLQAAVDNETAQQFRVYRRLEHIHERPRAILKCVAIEQRGEKPAYNTFEMVIEETTSGTLRLSRRGRKVYFLFAEGDSPNYRILGEHKTTTDDIHEIRLGTQSHHESITQVLWNHLTIRANGIETEEKLVKELNAARDRLPDNFTQLFNDNAIPLELFEVFGAVVPEETSLRMENLGTTNWSAARLRPRFGLLGDFDIEIDLADLEFVTPVVRRGSSFYFQIKYGTDDETRIELICGKGSQGRSMVYVQDRTIDRDGNGFDRKTQLDRVMLKDVNELKSLRIARRGKTIYCLYRLKDSPRDRLLAYKEYSNQPINAGDIYLMLTSGKPDQVSSVKLKAFRFRAETLFPDPEQLRPEPDDD